MIFAVCRFHSPFRISKSTNFRQPIQDNYSTMKVNFFKTKKKKKKEVSFQGFPTIMKTKRISERYVYQN